MENNETIAELYALRAGLSLIAQENGKLNYDVAVVESEKDRRISQAQEETAEKIEKDLNYVHIVENEVEIKQKNIDDETARKMQALDDETARKMQALDDEINEHTIRIQELKNKADEKAKKAAMESAKAAEEAAEKAELDISGSKPTESRYKYTYSKEQFQRNNETLKKNVSDFCREFSVGYTVKCAFGILFCILHILTAVYEIWSIQTLNIIGWASWIAFLVALAIEITECIWSYDECDWPDFYSDAANKTAKIFAYLSYIANIGAMLANAFILSPLSRHKSTSYYYKQLLENLPTTALTISIAVTSAAALAITLWITVKQIKDNPIWEYFRLGAEKRRAKTENRRLKKDLQKAEELEKAWQEYECQKTNARNEAINQARAKNLFSESFIKISSEIKDLENRSEKLYGQLDWLKDRVDKDKQKLEFETRKEKESLETENRKEKESLKESLVKRKDEHEKFKRNVNEECTMLCTQIEAHHNELCTILTSAHSEISTEIWKTLTDTYGKLLDVRDWRILDLVIWQLETGRADTIKEALQLADRETQTERLESAVSSASRSISEQIGMGFGNLQEQLDSQFHTLSQTLEGNFKTLRDGVEDAVSLVGRKFDRLNDSFYELDLKFRNLNWNLEDLSFKLDYSLLGIKHSIDYTNDSIAALSESQRDAVLEAGRGFEQIASQSSLQTALLEKANNSSRELIDIAKKMQNK